MRVEMICFAVFLICLVIGDYLMFLKGIPL